MSKTNNSFKPLIKAVLLAVAIILTPFVYATPTHDGGKATTEVMTVNMAKITDAEIVVYVKVANEAKRLALIIENDRGDELYRKDLDKTGFNSRVRLPKDNNVAEYKDQVKSRLKNSGAICDPVNFQGCRRCYDLQIVKLILNSGKPTPF